jgi:hypothetical protein
MTRRSRLPMRTIYLSSAHLFSLRCTAQSLCGIPNVRSIVGSAQALAVYPPGSPLRLCTLLCIAYAVYIATAEGYDDNIIDDFA